MRMPTSSTRLPCRLRGADDGVEVVAHLRDRQAAQAVVGAEREDDDRGLVRASAAAMRAAPPLVVSPLMLAFTTV